MAKKSEIVAAAKQLVAALDRQNPAFAKSLAVKTEAEHLKVLIGQ